jgi:hypothetical protein
LADCIDAMVVRHSFKRIEPTLDTVALVAAWKRKTLNMNRGIALLSLAGCEDHPGELVRSVRRALGKALGYVPFLYELGLQVVLFGPRLFERAAGLHHFLHTANTCTVVLQAIHIVDPDVNRLIGTAVPPLPGRSVDLGLPGWAHAIEKVQELKPTHIAMKTLGLHSGFERMKGRLNYSRDTGKGSLSVRTWGLHSSGALIDAVEAGIDLFLKDPV